MVLHLKLIGYHLKSKYFILLICTLLTLLSMNQICLITIYFGKKPKFFKLFIQSAQKNTDFDFLLFSNWNNLQLSSPNIIFNKINLSEFNNLAIKKQIITKPIIHPYKLCDLKPSWFNILEDKIPKHYKYVGYIDIDMILGKIDNFINLNILKNWDIWTITNSFLCGSLTIYRNNPDILNLYTKSKSWNYIANSSKFFAFDEDLNDNFRNTKIEGEKINSFTHLIKQEEKNGLKVCWQPNITYNFRHDTLQYNNGIITDLNGKEYLAYNFVFAKKFWLYYFPTWKKLPSKFYFNFYGLYKHEQHPLTLYRTLFYPPYCFFSLHKVLKSSLSIFKYFLRSLKKSLIEIFSGQAF